MKSRRPCLSLSEISIISKPATSYSLSLPLVSTHLHSATISSGSGIHKGIYGNLKCPGLAGSGLNPCHPQPVFRYSLNAPVALHSRS